MNKEVIKVAILEDHQSIIDGYMYRLGASSNIQVVASSLFGNALEPMLSEHQVDVLLLDLSVPISEENANVFPIRHELTKILPKFPNIKVVAISIFDQPELIRALIEVGIHGYILKDDHGSIQNLARIVQIVASGGMYFSNKLSSFIVGDSLDMSLTPRQVEALSLCVAYPDLATAVLAQKMGITGSTFRNLLSDAYQRLGVRTRNAAVSLAQEKGLLLGKFKQPKSD